MVHGRGVRSHELRCRGWTDGQNVCRQHQGPHDLDCRRRGHHVRCLGRGSHSSELLRRRYESRSTETSITEPMSYSAGKSSARSPWEGKLIRLTTGCWKTSSPVCNTDAGLWGVPSGTVGVQAPSEILYQFQDGGGATRTLGPVPTAVGVTIDQTGNTWVFAGTGRYYTQTSGTGDKIDTSLQYLVGIKDSVMQGSGGCAGGDVTITGCRLNSTLSNELIDMSTSTICQLGTGTCDGTATTAGNERAGDGCRRDLCVAHRACAKQKRVVCQIDGSGRWPPKRARPWPTRSCSEGLCSSRPSLRAATSVSPQESSNLYALYYVTGGAYSSPIVGDDGSEYQQKDQPWRRDWRRRWLSTWELKVTARLEVAA